MFAATALLFYAHCAEAGDICLVEDGKPSFAIVGRFAAEAAVRGPEGQPLKQFKRDAVRQAADLLSEAFLKCCGVKIAVLDEPDPQVAQYGAVIALGRTKWSEELGIDPKSLPREGFVARMFDGGVAIVGNDWVDGDYDVFNWRTRRLTCNGTLWGAQDFAEKVLGVRYFSTCDKGLWTDFPKRDRVVVSEFASADHPQYWFRAGYPNDGWRTATSGDCFGGEAPHPFDLAKAHPDRLEDIFFRDSHGTLWQDPEVYGRNFFDVTDTKLADILVDDFKAYYAQNGTGTYWKVTHAPSTRYLWFGQCDRGLDLDTPRARKMRRENAVLCDRTSEIYGRFYDYLARQCDKAFPGKTLVLMAYSTYLRPPRTVARFPDNLQILNCVGQPAQAWSEAHVREVRENYEGWNRLCAPDKKSVPYLYLMNYKKEGEGVTDFLSGYCMGEFLRQIADVADPHYYYPCFGRFGQRSPLGSYLLYRAAWNPKTDASADLRDFCPRMLGSEAGAKTVACLELIADRWRTAYIPGVAKGKYLGRNFRSIAQIEYDRLYRDALDAASLDRMERLLDEAEGLIAGDDLRKRRFDRIAGPLRKAFSRARLFQRVVYPSFSIGRKPTRLPAFRKAFVGEPLEGPCPEATARWDESGLTLEMRSPAPFKDGKGIFDGDSFELMLAPGREPVNLYQFSFASNGQIEDYHAQIDQPRGMDHNWVAKGLRYEAKRDAEGWSVHLHLPWTALYDAPPKAGDIWKINLISNRTSPSEYASVSPTFNNNRFFDMYATVTFGD